MSKCTCNRFTPHTAWVKGRDCSRCWSAFHRGGLTSAPVIHEPPPVALCNDRGKPVHVPEHPLRLYVICDGESVHKGKAVCTCVECNPTCGGYNA